MSAPLMPKATALWLIENTTLTFKQIADFCQPHFVEVQAIADGEIGHGIQPFDPLANEQISKKNLEECLKDPSARLILLVSEETFKKKKVKRRPEKKEKEISPFLEKQPQPKKKNTQKTTSKKAKPKKASSFKKSTTRKKNS